MAPYIRTKPLHKSQKVIECAQDGSTVFEIEVIVNPELERDLMAYGEGIRVLAPKALAERLRQRHLAAARRYDE